ncbi:citrate/2-methylcitrate synthase [Devosia algicola]|uniref:citrate synthase (unknown stereospecificity) n=1 Tax=Devosia algicola TaxID=3026418 RepID=A0ABY7YLE5_9HYPH|nr:citrate/2-methylcitrate synthase [Devosia algicola]WDR01884.1 citrate/2-methylcitrate synthase [Devosia algicola]
MVRTQLSLSQSVSLEAIAGLLWDCPHPVFRVPDAFEVPENRAPLEVLADLAGTQLPTLGRNGAMLQTDATQTVGALAATLAGPSRPDLALHLRLADHWARPASADMVRRVLVLLAEHELNASTFAVRVTASTGASLAAAALAGLAALSGPLHGGAAAAMGDLTETAKRIGARKAIESFLQQGRPIPCVGHRLYPQGDVRAEALIEHFKLPAIHAELYEAIESIVGEQPNIDFALAALASAFDLPAEGSLCPVHAEPFNRLACPCA